MKKENEEYMAKLKRITLSLFLALIMCFSFSTAFTVSADELSSDDWEQISLDLQQGSDEQSGEDFNFIKNNTANNDDGEWILFLGLGFVLIGLCGITYAVLSSKKQRAIAKKRREDYIRNMNTNRRKAPQNRARSRSGSLSSNTPQSRTSAGKRAQDISSRQSSHDFIKGSRYADEGVKRPRHQTSSNSYGDSFDITSHRYREDNDDVKTYTRKSSTINKNPDYEDTSSFSSSDTNIYSSSSKNSNEKENYINDYIDY